MPKRKDERKWTEPAALVPIIAAVISAIVGPTFVYIYLTNQGQVIPIPPPTEEPTPPTRTPPPGPDEANITVETDKQSYSLEEIIEISGNIREPEKGQTLRIDIYNPDGMVLSDANGVMIEPNRNGTFAYDFRLFPSRSGELIPGEYKILVTYLHQSTEGEFRIE